MEDTGQSYRYVENTEQFRSVDPATTDKVLGVYHLRERERERERERAPSSISMKFSRIFILYLLLLHLHTSRTVC